MRQRRIYKRMYAVSHPGLGLVAGTLAYKRRDAIECFTPLGQWEMYKREGYRTVVAMVKLIKRAR
jgi:hypothetical protein